MTNDIYASEVLMYILSPDKEFRYATYFTIKADKEWRQKLCNFIDALKDSDKIKIISQLMLDDSTFVMFTIMYNDINDLYPNEESGCSEFKIVPDHIKKNGAINSRRKPIL